MPWVGIKIGVSLNLLSVVKDAMVGKINKYS